MAKPDMNPVETAQRILGFAFCYFILALCAAFFARQPGHISTLWFANAVGVAFLACSRKSLTPVILIAAALAGVAAHLTLGDKVLRSLAFLPPNVIEMWLAAILLRKTNCAGVFAEGPQNFLRFLIAATVLPALAGASIGAATSWLSGPGDFLQIWSARYAASTIASVGLLPVAFLCLQRGFRIMAATIAWRKTAMWTLTIICVGTYTLANLPFPFVYIMAPLTISAVFLNFESVAVLVCISVVAIGGAIATGNFAAASQLHGQILQIYLPLLLTFVPPMLMAAGINQNLIKEKLRERAEDALRRSHQDLHTIIDHTPAMIGYWDRNLRNRFANRAYIEWFGASPEKLRDMHIRDVVGEERYALNLPYIEAVLRGESPVFERTITDRSGNVRHTLASYLPDRVGDEIQGFYAFVNDITSLKTAQQDQSVARMQLEGIIDAASEFSIIATDMLGKIRVFSPGAERMLGYRADEIVGIATPALFHLPEELAARSAALSNELGRRVRQFEVFAANVGIDKADVREWTYRRKDGTFLPVRLVLTAILDADGCPTGYLGIASDISLQNQLQLSLIKAKELAEAASRAKSEFVANMSHEIRTPMNAVLGMAHLLENTPLTPDQRNYLDMIRDSGRSLLSILNDILDFSKIEAGKMDLTEEAFDLGEVLNALAAIMTVNAGEKDLELAIGIEPDVPQHLVGDALRLQQVLINLAGNAIKFTERGEVAVLVDLEHVGAGGAAETVNLRFRISDTGIGMDVAQQEKVFSAFSQADSSTTRRFGGTGLGLAICKRLVDLMGGNIQLRSQSGLGSEFLVTIPMKVAAPATAPNSAPVHPREKPLQILVIDDSATSRDYLSRTIRALDWHADVATSGAEGIALAVKKSRFDRPYDMILIDWQMPQEDGVATMISLRDALQDDLPYVVIMVSAFGRGKMLGDKVPRRADAVLVKPVTKTSLMDILRESPIGYSGMPRARAPEPYLHQLNRGIDGARILLVEDNRLNQIVARSMLEQAGAMVDAVENGLQAVERMAERNADYDLILMDVQMPMMDGCSATVKIREELGLTLPILAMTAGVMATEQAHCKASGMNDFISKPINVDQMFGTIARHLPMQGKPTKDTTPAFEKSALGNAGEVLCFDPAPLLLVGEEDPEYQQKIIGLIRNVVQTSPAEFTAARKALHAASFKESAAILHAMRGTLGALGATDFAATTLEIEKALNNGMIDLADSLFHIAGGKLDRTMAAAAQWLAGQDEMQARAEIRVGKLA
jgi:PAS domain S-box-containing protein